MYKTKNKKGFTLVEIVVVISIILVMTAVLLVQLADRKEDRELEVAMRQIASGLRQAQNFALTGKVVDGLRPCHYFFDSAGNFYRIRYEAYDPSVSGASCTTTATTASRETVTVGNGISITATNLGFTVPSGRIYDQAQPSQVLPITTIDLAKGSVVYRICVYPSGRIEELGSSGTCS